MSAAIDARQDAPAPPDRPSAAFTCTELLVPFFRVTRSPLATWTQSLLDRYAQAQATPVAGWYSACDQVASCFNEASLIELHFGRPDHALVLCNSEIEWARRVSAKSGRLAAAQFAFQPYINLGRLDRTGHRWDDAILKFRRLRKFFEGESIEIGTLLVTRRHAMAIRDANPGFAEQMTANYLVDTLVTLLRAGRFADVCELVDAGTDVRLEWVNDLLDEARLIALSQMGETDGALQRAEAYLRRPHRPHGAVFLYRRAELLLAGGDRAGAARIASGLAAAHIISPAPVDRINMRLLVRLAGLLTSLGDDRAEPLTRAGLATARHLNDVIFEQELLSLLATNAAIRQEQCEAKSQADTVLRRNWYGAAHLAPTAADATYVSIDRLYECLLSCGDMW